MEESASHHVRVILTSSDSLLLSISVATSEFETTDVKHEHGLKMRKSGAGESVGKCFSEL